MEDGVEKTDGVYGLSCTGINRGVVHEARYEIKIINT